MANTGVRARVEADDRGGLAVKVFAAAEWRPGEVCTVGDEVELPVGLRERLRAALAEVLAGCASSALALAKESAVEHAAAMAGRAKRSRFAPRFEGKVDVKGSDAAG